MTEDLHGLAMAAIAASTATDDPDYPMFHLAPPVGRLNDPNGLVVRDGVYHACYQFSPFHPHRKLVYWGHASSLDLATWTHHEPAIVPDSWYDRSGAYSGSAVVHEGETVLVYTGNVRPDEGGRESYQCLVRSSDMEHFVKDSRNPVLPTLPGGYTEHVRDPQVWREGDRYRMFLGAQREDLTGCALLFSSPDLLEWAFDGELRFPIGEGRFDALGYMWECPALIRVPDEVTDEIHDVLVCCPQGLVTDQEGFENIFPACYLIGRLDGLDFHSTGEFREIDRGFEFYAPQAFAEGPRTPLLIAWAGNASEDDQPSIERGWVHLMSIARELTVRDGRLVQRPRLAQPATQQQQSAGVSTASVDLAPDALAGSRAFALTAELGVSEGATWQLRLGSEASHVDIVIASDRLEVDRSSARYAPQSTRRVSLPDVDVRRVTVIHDRSVTEIFVDDGEVAFTMRSYLDPSVAGARLLATVDGVAYGVSAQRFD